MLTRADLLEPAAFAAARNKLQAAVIAAKAARRVPLGEHMTFLFENHATIAWQIQEMARVEGLHGDALDHELATYNPLLPTATSLSATLLIEYADPDERQQELVRLRGLHQHVFLDLDGLPRVPARFDESQFGDRRISSVQFLRFDLSPAALAALGDLQRGARLACDHPVYQEQVELGRGTRGALLDDLAEAAARHPGD